MISEDVKYINELVEKLKVGEIGGTIEITVNNKGRINRVLIKKKDEPEEDVAEKVELEKPDLSHADFSEMDVSWSDFSGLDMHEADFSHSTIQYSNLSQTNLEQANFYKAHISKTDISNSYGVNMQNAYMTGSVNLYNTNPVPVQKHDEGPEYIQDEMQTLETAPKYPGSDLSKVLGSNYHSHSGY